MMHLSSITWSNRGSRDIMRRWYWRIFVLLAGLGMSYVGF